jgi:hypothetical protein
MFSHFYNESIRKLVIGFGGLFNQIQVHKFNENGTVKEKVLVPISYGPKEKFVRRIRNMSSISEDVNKTQITLPHIGFDITAVIYDVDRVTNKLRKKQIKKNDNTGAFMFNAVPYNFQFGLYVFTRYVEENLQIMEQILPYFTPNFNVTLNMNTVHPKVDVPITLNAVQMQEDYIGDFATRRSIISTFSFTAKSFVFGPETSFGPIEGVTVDLLDGFTCGSSVSDPSLFSVGITGDYATGVKNEPFSVTGGAYNG